MSNMPSNDGARGVLLRHATRVLHGFVHFLRSRLRVVVPDEWEDELLAEDEWVRNQLAMAIDIDFNSPARWRTGYDLKLSVPGNYIFFHEGEVVRVLKKGDLYMMDPSLPDDILALANPSSNKAACLFGPIPPIPADIFNDPINMLP